MAERTLLRLAEQLDLKLPADVVEWCDSEIWREWSSRGFGEPLHPDEIEGHVWAGQMLPDTLSFIGDGSGDYLCLRFHTDGTVSELVAWSHEGGGWAHFGNTLCEALLFDAARSSVHDPDPAANGISADGLIFANWALRTMASHSEEHRFKEGLTLDNLLESGIAELAVRQELCKNSWISGLLKQCFKFGGMALAQEVGVEWSDFARWTIDTALIPENFTNKLALATGLSVEEILQQDWENARQHAEQANRLRTDLLWPYSIMGWSAERNGRLDAAVDHYYAGLKKMQTTASFTENWRLTDDLAQRKFVLERLNALQTKVPRVEWDDPYLHAGLALWKPHEEFRGIRSYWLDEATRAENRSVHNRAYWSYYCAGWDMYQPDPQLLHPLAVAAQNAGWPALASLARLHLENAPSD
jgi:hypothetical protein